MIPIDSKSITVTDSLILDDISGDTPNDICTVTGQVL